MAQYAIEETTLTSIGEALRNYYGETRIKYNKIPGTVMKKISKTPNALSFTQKDGTTLSKGLDADVITIPGAVKLEITLAVQTYNTSTDYIAIIADPDKTLPLGSTKGTSTDTVKYYAGTTLTNYTEVFEGVDTVVFFRRTAYQSAKYLGYYAEIVGYDENGNLIEDIEAVVEPNTYLPSQMSSAINNIKTENCYYNSTESWYKSGSSSESNFLIDLRKVLGTSEDPGPFIIDIKACVNDSSYAGIGTYQYENGVLTLIKTSTNSTSTKYWFNVVSQIKYKQGMIFLKTSSSLGSAYNGSSYNGWVISRLEAKNKETN